MITGYFDGQIRGSTEDCEGHHRGYSSRVTYGSGPSKF